MTGEKALNQRQLTPSESITDKRSEESQCSDKSRKNWRVRDLQIERSSSQFGIIEFAKQTAWQCEALAYCKAYAKPVLIIRIV